MVAHYTSLSDGRIDSNCLPTTHLSCVGLARAVSDHFCNFLNPPIRHSYPVHAVIGQLYGDEKGSRGLNFSFVIFHVNNWGDTVWKCALLSPNPIESSHLRWFWVSDQDASWAPSFGGPTGRRPWGRPRTCWRDYISHLVWECLGIP